MWAGTSSQALSRANLGALLYPTHADEDTASVTPIDRAYPVGHVNRYGDNTTPGTTVMTTAIQNAIDVMAVSGGAVTFNHEIYACIDIVLKTGVILLGDGGPTWSGSHLLPTQLLATGAGTVVKSDGTTTLRNAAIVGLELNGLGSGTAVKGVHFDNVSRCAVKRCSFDNFSDQAIKLDSDTGACLIKDSFAQNCLLNRTRSQKDGVLDISGNDHWIVRGEYTASVSALTDSNARCCAVTVSGGTHMLQDVIGEISDAGFHIATGGTTLRMVGCRADLNYGNGFEINSTTILTACLSLRNSRETDNTFDGYLTTVGHVIFNGCLATSLGADAWQHRYGFNDSQNSDSIKSYYDSGCRSTGHDTASFNTADFAGAGVNLPEGAHKTFANSDTTPSVDGYRSFRTSSTGAAITTFDDGVSGQEITVQGLNTNSSFVNGSTLKTTTKANKTCVAGAIYKFVLQNGVWYEVGVPIALNAYTPTNVNADRAFDADSTTTAELADVLGTLIADLQARSLLG